MIYLKTYETYNNYNSKIYCDMDGVLCDFQKKFKFLSGGISIENYSKKYGWNKSWKLIEKNGINFWSELDWTKDGKLLWNNIKDLNNVEILTGIPYGLAGDFAIKGKKIWIEKHLDRDIKFNYVYGGADKYIYIRESDILIDDSKRNINLWEKHGGIPIEYTNIKDVLNKLKLYLKFDENLNEN